MPQTLEEQERLLRESYTPPVSSSTGLAFSTNDPNLNRSISSAPLGGLTPLSGAITKDGVLSSSAVREMEGFRHLYTPEKFAELQAQRARQEMQERSTAISSAEATRRQIMGGQIQEQFGIASREAEEQSKEQRGRVIGAASMQSQGLGASSAINGFLETISDRFAERRKRLEEARKAALSAADADMFGRIEQRLSQLSLQEDEAIDRIQQRQIQVQEQAFGIQKEASGQERQRQQDELSQLQTIGSIGGIVPPQLQTTLDARFGQGFSNQYLQAQKQIISAKSQQDQFAAMKTVFGILQNVPAGQKISLGGNDYEGLKTSTPNTTTFKEEDALGNVTFVTVDDATGEIISAASGGNIGKGRAPVKSTDTGGAPRGTNGVEEINPEVESIAQDIFTGLSLQKISDLKKLLSV